MRLLLLLFLLCHCAAANSQMLLQGLDHFSAAEQQKLRLWLEQSFHATNQLLGPYPFLTYVSLSPHSGSEPVPWAYTQRMEQQQVFFQVDSRFTFTEFQQDWTAAHEFSHLALPLLDKEDLWFAEGFASYMQYQVLQHQGQLTETPVYWYQQKLRQVAPLLANSATPLVRQLKLWLQQKHYKAAYWGSALFFIEADQLLQKRGLSLSHLIRRYQRQHRLTDQNLAALIRSLDTLAGHPVFATLLDKYQQQSSQTLWRQHPAFFAHHQQAATEP